jgi:ribosomal protein S18 acetylase RimI-like enzyme
MAAFTMRPIADGDRAPLTAFCTERWGTPLVVSRGKIHEVTKGLGFLSEVDGKFAGAVTYNIVGDRCEITWIETLVQNIGAGSAFIEAVRHEAIKAGCKRLWLITTNDNTYAIRFYQRRGFVIAAVHVNAIEHSRKLKPEIPMTGFDGIPIRDEIEFEINL